MTTNGPKISLSAQQVKRWFGGRIKTLAERARHTDRDDMEQLLKIACITHQWIRSPTRCQHTGTMVPVNPAHVNRFLKSRAIDIERKERTREQRFPVVNPLPESFVIEAVPEGDADRVLRVLAVGLTPQELEIVRAKAFQPSHVRCVAVKRYRQAVLDRKNGQLRMNIKEPVVDNQCVAEAFNTSPATVGRVIVKAQSVLMSEGWTSKNT